MSAGTAHPTDYGASFPPPPAVEVLAGLILGQLTADPELARSMALSRPFAPLLLLVSVLEQLRELPVDRPLYRRLVRAAFERFMASWED